jgi:predicted outer membrane repeat protein
MLEVLEDRAVPSTVTNTNDSGPGSLRDTIAQAHTGDLIDFDPSLAGGVITLTSGELAVDKSVTIKGLGADQLTINGNNQSRVLRVTTGTALTVSDQTVSGGAVVDSSSSDVTVFGGGILNAGNLTLSRVWVTSNLASASVSGDGAPRGVAQGGGIYNTGTLRLVNTVVSSNVALVSLSAAGDSLYEASGGGVYNSGTLIVTACTFSGNQSGLGGGIYNTGTLNLADSTLSANSAYALSGGVYPLALSAAGGGLGNTGSASFSSCKLSLMKVQGG